jgi:OOP family OmpA-OmpF porin
MLLSYLVSVSTALATPDEFPSINSQYFRPAIDSKYFVWVNESDPGKDKALNFRGIFSYANKPFVYTDFDGNRTELLKNITQLDLVGGYTMGNVRIGADVPVIIRANGSLPGGEEISDTTLGDLVLDAKYRFTKPTNTLGVAIVVRSTIPTSPSTMPIGSEDPVIEGELSVDAELDKMFIALNLGHRQQGDWTHEQGMFGPQFFVRGGLGFLLDEKKGLSTEFVSSRLYEFNDNTAPFSSEVLLSGWSAMDALIVRAGIGAGIGAGVGTPSWRGILAVEYQPKIKPKDTDMDGIIDKVDQCPKEPEDVDGVKDEDGCPDFTDVTITFVDQFGVPVARKKWTAEEIALDENGKPVVAAIAVPKEDTEKAGDETPEGTEKKEATPIANNANLIEGYSGVPFAATSKDFILRTDFDGYRPVEQVFKVVDGQPQNVEIKVEMILGQLAVNPKDPDGNPVADAVWNIDGSSERHNIDEILDLPPKEYVVQVAADGYKLKTERVEVKADETTSIDIELIPTKAQVKDGMINFDGTIHFKTNSAVIEPVSFSLLNDIGDILKDFPSIKQIRIEGHTDSDGSAASNKNLSQNRADAVRQYLISYDISGERMIAEGFGEEKPKADNKTEVGKQQNRRVEIFILKVDQSKVNGIHDIKLDRDIEKHHNLDEQ